VVCRPLFVVDAFIWVCLVQRFVGTHGSCPTRWNLIWFDGPFSIVIRTTKKVERKLRDSHYERNNNDDLGLGRIDRRRCRILKFDLLLSIRYDIVKNNSSPLRLIFFNYSPSRSILDFIWFGLVVCFL
jgi:hypothetical protein